MQSERLVTSALSLAFVLGMTAPAHADVVVGPRASYYFDNSNLRNTDLTSVTEAGMVLSPELEAALEDALGEDVAVSETGFSEALLADQIGFPMIGAMVNFGGDRDRFTLTAMIGSGSGQAELIATRSVAVAFSGGTIRDTEVQTLIGDTQIDRIDIEATWQRRLNENFALTGGIRYERLDRTDDGLFTAVASEQILSFLLDDASAPLRSEPGVFTIASESTVETVTARFGGTAFVPVGDNINTFFSGMMQVGYQPDFDQQLTTAFPDSPELGSFTDQSTQNGEISMGPDMAVGMQVILMENLALDLRYRAIVVFPLSGDFEFSDARVNHGVNIGLSLRL